MKRAPTNPTLPLFGWSVRSEVLAIAAERQALKVKIDRMRPRSARRLKLEEVLRELTLKQLCLAGRHEGQRN